ncbi:hypothetical protein EDD18DRAFT_1107257 [Armillaria luteobubalina]|uniref:Uncharacterized protein n=1 Tax=Armillaria luteobubalina TaxID=153913 RepID=A0AA39Q2K0_9AGAR|nr:hypothetical protein EDD18DRAFT_1107257 [Armillaria luteobubalina]
MKNLRYVLNEKPKYLIFPPPTDGFLYYHPRHSLLGEVLANTSDVNAGMDLLAVRGLEAGVRPSNRAHSKEVELVHKAERDGIQAEGPQLVLDGDADQGGGEGRVHQPRSGGEVELNSDVVQHYAEVDRSVLAVFEMEANAGVDLELEEWRVKHSADTACPNTSSKTRERDRITSTLDVQCIKDTNIHDLSFYRKPRIQSVVRMKNVRFCLVETSDVSAGTMTYIARTAKRLCASHPVVAGSMQSRLPRGTPTHSRAVAHFLDSRTPAPEEFVHNLVECDGVRAEIPWLVLKGEADEVGGNGGGAPACVGREKRGRGEVALSTRRNRISMIC